MDRKNIFGFFFIEFKKTPKICNSRLEYSFKWQFFYHQHFIGVPSG